MYCTTIKRKELLGNRKKGSRAGGSVGKEMEPDEEAP